MQTKFTKLNAIRDESADKYADNEENDSIAWAFSAGWDAAMERAQGLLKCLEIISTDVPETINTSETEVLMVKAAKSALEKFRGEK